MTTAFTWDFMGSDLLLERSGSGFQLLCKHEAQVERVDVLGKPAVEGSEDGFADGRAMLEDVGVPETQDGIAVITHVLVTDTVVGAVGVLRAVNFDDKPSF